MRRIMLLWLGLAAFRAADAQHAADMRAGVAAHRFDSLATGYYRRRGLAQPPRANDRALQFAPFMSALVPGSGQFLLGQDRFVAYAIDTPARRATSTAVTGAFGRVLEAGIATSAEIALVGMNAHSA